MSDMMHSTEQRTIKSGGTPTAGPPATPPAARTSARSNKGQPAKHRTAHSATKTKEVAAAEEQERRHLDAAHGIAGNISERTSPALQSRQRRRKALTLTEASRAAVAVQAAKRHVADDAMITPAIDKKNREIIERSAKGLLPLAKDKSEKRGHNSAANVVESEEADLARVLTVFDENPATTYAQMQACREAVDRHVANQASRAGLKLSKYHFAG